MSDLWAFGRRPSCMVRYRHGGYSAIYPRGNPLLSDEAGAYVALTAKGEIAAEPLLEARVEGGKSDNILSFPGGHARKARQGSGRGKSRPGPANATVHPKD